MGRIVEGCLQLIPGAEGATVELAEGETIVYACCSGTLAGALGMRLRLDDSLSGLAVRSGSTLSCTDTETDPRVDRDACRRVGAASMVCVPLRRDGQAVGVLKVISSSVGAFDDRDVATLTGLAEFVTTTIAASTELHHAADTALSTASAGPDVEHEAAAARISAFVAHVAHPGVAASVDAAHRIDEVLETKAFVPVYQPVFELATKRLAGVEALTRFLPGPYRTPDVWFAEAHQVGRGTELELAAVDKALSFAGHLPPGCHIAVNFGPEALEHDKAAGALGAIDPHQVVVELTEHVHIDDYPRLQATLKELRARGVRLAIDDTGSGFASFSHIVKLAPDIIKVDMELICGIDVDPVRRSLVGAVVTFAADTGASVVAEGIETDDELETVCQLGVGYGQGYLLGRPGPPELLDAYRASDERAYLMGT